MTHVKVTHRLYTAHVKVTHRLYIAHVKVTQRLERVDKAHVKLRLLVAFRSPRLERPHHTESTR